MISLNDFLVGIRLKSRTGMIKKSEFIDSSIVSGAGICVVSKVKEIDYKYNWTNPFKKIVNAKKKRTPFTKHSNPGCMYH